MSPWPGTRCSPSLVRPTQPTVQHARLIDRRRVLTVLDANNLASFHRSPTELRRYRKFVSDVSLAHGSVLNFMLNYRLCWTDITAHGAPFADPRDIKILHNDWPYGLAKGIVHLVVWTKFTLPEDPATGDLTKEMRATIAGFVETTFMAEVGQENVRICIDCVAD
jgi:hypothetical protein